MKLNLEENKLRELFLELRREDEGAAPPFNEAWETASSPLRQMRWRRYVLRVTAAAAMLAALGVAVIRFISPLPAQRLAPGLISDRAVPANGSVSSSLPWQSTVLISQWRAPTDFLLQSPGEELLKAVPRPGQSQNDLPAKAPAGKN